MKQITSYKEDGLYLVYNLLLRLLFLCAPTGKAEDLDLSRGAKFVSPISPMFRCVLSEHDFVLCF
jgi:hypothetical protein